MSSTGMPSVMQTMSSISASAASMMASAANGGGTKITVASAPVLSTASCHGVEYGEAVVRGAAFAGGDSADNFGAVFGAGFGVERAFAAGQALRDDARGFIDQNAHSKFSGAMSRFKPFFGTLKCRARGHAPPQNHAQLRIATSPSHLSLQSRRPLLFPRRLSWSGRR